MSKSVYIVMVQGWGDREEEFYNCGTFSTKAKALAGVEEMLQDWEADGGDRADVVYEIERSPVR